MSEKGSGKWPDKVLKAIMTAQSAIERRPGTSNGDVNAMIQPITLPRHVLETLLGVIAEQEQRLCRY